jgi:hypothetical protein
VGSAQASTLVFELEPTAYLRPSTTGKVFLQLYQKDQQLDDITGQKV